MIQNELQRGRKDEAELYSRAQQALNVAPNEQVVPTTKEPLRMEQWRIIFAAIQKSTAQERSEYLLEEITHPHLKGVCRGQLLLEYTTAQLARTIGETQLQAHRQGRIQFAIPGIGDEAIGAVLGQQLKQTDFVFPYYRQESVYLSRGGTAQDLLLMTAQKADDPNSGGVVLAGHPASDWQQFFPVISNVGAHVLAAAGLAQALELRRKQGITQKSWQFANDPDAIAACDIGDASMAQGEVREAIEEALMNGGSPLLLIVHNNQSGISTDVAEGSASGDPIEFARGYRGLLIIEVDASDMVSLHQKASRAVEYTRKTRKPVILHCRNVYKRTHSSSDDPSRYTDPETLAKREAADPLPKMRALLQDQEIVSKETLDNIDRLVLAKVRQSLERTLLAEDGDPTRIYQNVYADPFRYGPFDPEKGKWLDPHQPIGEKPHLDYVQSSREARIPYGELADSGQVISMRQAITITLAQEMKRHPEIICFGEDVADLSSSARENLEEYFWNRAKQREDIRFSEAEQKRINSWLKLISQGKGYKLQPENFALLVDVLGGKGGVFKNTQFLQYLYGHNRVWNSRLAEASILGTAVGYATAGFVPVVEIQFDAYLTPASQQLIDQISTLRWRSGGQYTAGMVIRVQGLNRLGGVGGIGHGDVITGRLTAIPGVRTVVPANASEAGPLLREAIRLAQEHGEVVVFYEPIMELNANMGYLQAPDLHIPIGEAEVVQQGENDDILVLTYGNNLPLVLQAQKKWRSGADGFSATIVNLRTLGTQTDWFTIAPLIKQVSKVMIVESERAIGSAGTTLAAQVSTHYFEHLDAAVRLVSARDIRTPAGTANENYALPQVEDIVVAGRQLATY